MHHALSLQILGYAASVLIVISMLMRSIVKLRIINLLGAATFAIYGYMIGAWPVGILNTLTSCINVVQLVRLRNREEYFHILEVTPDSHYARYFLTFQAQDISRFFPRFRFEPAENPLMILVLRDLVPAGLLLGLIRGDVLEVHLDYVLPQYRDLKVGKFLFSDEAQFFRNKGVREIVAAADTDVHASYLTRMGFARTADPRVYRLDVA